MSALQALRNGRAKITRPEDWCKGRMYINKADGGMAFCSLGAMYSEMATHDYSAQECLATEMYLARAVYLEMGMTMDRVWNNIVSSYNDHSTHSQVLAMWDKAIELALQDEQKQAAYFTVVEAIKDSALLGAAVATPAPELVEA